MSLVTAVYARMPTPLQNRIISTYGLYWRWSRLGGGYPAYVREYADRERFRPKEWEGWTRARLREVLSIAADEVPYYVENWSEAERQAARRGELSRLPVTEKDAIRRSPHAFVRKGRRVFPKWSLLTSGSTGTPVTSIWTLEERRRSIAVREARSARWAGVSYNLPRATFSGRMVEPDPHSQGPFHRYNRAERQVYLSAFHLRPATAGAYVEALRQHEVQWLTGYAVSFHMLACMMLDQGLEPPPLKAIITTSEKLTPEMRKRMREAYNCPVYEEYGAVENVLFASECEKMSLHVSPDVGVIEILRPDGSPCSPGEVGEVVATSTLRTYQPFVRYRIGDLAAWSPVGCECGRNLPVISEVVGRTEDVVVGPDGRQMVRFHGLYLGLPRIRSGQVIQERVDRIRVRVVADEGFGEYEVDEIERRVRQRLGDVDVRVEKVDEIPRTESGKFRAVISLVDNP